MKKVAICLAASAMMAVMGVASLTSMTTVAQAQDYSGGDAKKMRSTLPADTRSIYESFVGLVQLWIV